LGGAFRVEGEELGENFVADFVGPAVAVGLFLGALLLAGGFGGVFGVFVFLVV
jgi:hypothetical protein